MSIVSFAGAAATGRIGLTVAEGRVSGSFTTSSARARLGRRRMNPRSSSAEISRCTPDLDLRSSASRISSKLGLIPLSLRRLSMKSSNSRCLAVSIGRHSPERTNGELLGNEMSDVKRRLAAAGQQPRTEGLDRFLVPLRLHLTLHVGDELIGIILRRRLAEFALDLSD